VLSVSKYISLRNFELQLRSSRSLSLSLSLSFSLLLLTSGFWLLSIITILI
jgi:hypothetical protein